MAYTIRFEERQCISPANTIRPTVDKTKIQARSKCFFLQASKIDRHLLTPVISTQTQIWVTRNVVAVRTDKTF